MTASDTKPQANARVPAGVLAIGRSLLINVLGSWLAFKLVAPHFPEHSAVPLLAATAIPTAYMIWELAKARTLDGVAVIQLTLSGLSALTAVVAQDQHAGLVATAFQPLGLGLVFGLSALFGRPFMQTLARQAMCGNDPGKGAGFDRAVAEIPAVRRQLMLISAIWTGVLACETVLRLAMVQIMPASTYVLAANIMGYGVPGALVWLSIGLGKRLQARLQTKHALATEGQAS